MIQEFLEKKKTILRLGLLTLLSLINLANLII